MQRYPLRADLRVPYHEQPGQDGALVTFDDVSRLVRLEHRRDGAPIGHALDIDHGTGTVTLTNRTRLAPGPDTVDAQALLHDAVDHGLEYVWGKCPKARRLRGSGCMPVILPPSTEGAKRFGAPFRGARAGRYITTELLRCVHSDRT